MGWFAINILLPVFAPLALLFIAGKICTPIEPFASRISILRTVKDGQLGWVAVVFSANSAYELFAHVQSNIPPNWAGPALTLNIVILVISGMAAVLGALFPVEESPEIPKSLKTWMQHYPNLCTSIIAVVVAAFVLYKVHLALELACN